MSNLETEYKKLVVLGELGCGKTRLVSTLSEISAFNTDVKSSVDIGKEFTTVGIDYGRISLGENDALGVYGVPGQDRYSFVWNSVKSALWGIVFLIRYGEENNITSIEKWLDYFEVSKLKTPCIIGISHSENAPQSSLSELMSVVNQKLQQLGVIAPVLPVDNRDRSQAITLLNTLNTLASIK